MNENQNIINEIKNYLHKLYNTKEYIAVYTQSINWQKSKPLNNLEILDATPIFDNTLTKYLSLLEGGAKLSVGVSSAIPHNEETLRLLKMWGVNIVDLSIASNLEFDIILDCAGAFAKTKSRLGYVELTRSGLEYYENSNKPVFLADEGKIKEIETILGTGESFIRALQSLGYTDLKGKNIVIFGYGKVGKGIAMYLKLAGAKLHIVDNHQIVSIDSDMEKIDYKNSEAIEKVLKTAWCVVSVTGKKNAWQGMFNPTELIKSNTLIANMGVEDEFGLEIPSDRVLNNKKPLNFILHEPTRLRYIESTMALHNYGAYLLANDKLKNRLNRPTLEIEEPILELSITQGLIGEEIKLLEV